VSSARRPRPGGWRTALPVLLLLVGLLPGCGFQLRGAVDIPSDLTPLYIQSGGLIGDAIEARLQGSDVQLTNRPTDAGLVLRILSQRRRSRVVAVDRRGKALAYVLTYRVSFDAQDGTGKTLVERQEVSLDRTFDDNPDVSVLGKDLESDIIYQDMADDAADQVLLRLRAALAQREDSAGAQERS